jgi:hypothetical protein
MFLNDGDIRKNAKPQVLIRGLAPYFKIQLPKSGIIFPSK